MIYEYKVNIKFMGQKNFKENYKVVIIMEFLLHQDIVPKIFLVDTLLNTKNLLET